PINSGSEPKICTPTGASLSSVSRRGIVFLLPYQSALALIISVTTASQPCSLHSRRKARSVTPAMGPRMTGNGLPYIFRMTDALSLAVFCVGISSLSFLFIINNLKSLQCEAGIIIVNAVRLLRDHLAETAGCHH